MTALAIQFIDASRWLIIAGMWGAILYAGYWMFGRD